MRLASSDAEAVIQRLAVGHGRALPAAELAQAVPVWRDVLDGVPWLDLERAVDDAIRNPSRFMPKPGEIRAKALASASRDQRRGQETPPDVWATEPWDPGRTPEGQPMLCSKCGGDVWFAATSPGHYVGHIRHRRTCGQAIRIERAKGDFSMPAGPDAAALAAKRRAYYEAASDARGAA